MSTWAASAGDVRQARVRCRSRGPHERARPDDAVRPRPEGPVPAFVGRLRAGAQRCSALPRRTGPGFSPSRGRVLAARA